MRVARVTNYIASQVRTLLYVPLPRSLASPLSRSLPFVFVFCRHRDASVENSSSRQKKRIEIKKKGQFVLIYAMQQG